jgi:hypothetical protein
VWVYPQAGVSPTFLPRRLAHLQTPGYFHFFGETVLDGALPDVLEIFLDGTHTHFVHSGLIRTGGIVKILLRSYGAARIEWRLSMRARAGKAA